ncbi:MAG: HAD family hydrolase [Cyanobacteria bacterium J06649_4]
MTRPQKLTTALSNTEGSASLKNIRLVATDMDGTLTDSGQFTPALLQAFERLAQNGFEVMIVTGRSAGWVSGLVHYLPVVGAIAENGGLYIDKRNPEPVILPDIPRMSQHRDRLASVFKYLRDRYPSLRPAADNPYRLTDWTFDIDGLTKEDIAWMQETSARHAMGFTYSTVQCHLKVAHQNKAQGLIRTLKQRFPKLSTSDIITVGDSPNDESLFDPQQFPHSVGVANVTHYLSDLSHAPTYLTDSPEVYGFLELTQQLIAAK